MPYITDAAKEYAKQQLAKDKSKYRLISKEEEKKINDIAAKYEFEADLMKNDNTKVIVFGTNEEHLNDIANDIKALSDKYVISKAKNGRKIGKDTFVLCTVRKIADSYTKDDIQNNNRATTIQQFDNDLSAEENLILIVSGEMLFKLATLMNNYLDKSYRMAKQCQEFMVEQKIISKPDDIDLDSARVNFDDDILSIKSVDDAIDYIENYIIDNTIS